MQHQMNQLANIFSNFISPDKSAIVSSILNKLPIQLPLEQHQDVEAFEKYLSKEATFNASVVYFGSHGGNHKKEVIHLIMRNLMTDELSSNYNMKGRGSKYAFEEHKNILNLIFCAALRNAQASDITLLEVKKIVQDWLKYGKSRYDRSLEKELKFLMRD